MALATIHIPRLSSSTNSPLIPLTHLQTQQPLQYRQTTAGVPSKSLTIHPTVQRCLTTIRTFHRLRLQVKTIFPIKVVPVPTTTHPRLVGVVCLLSCRWRNSRSQPPLRSSRVLADEGTRHISFALSRVVGAHSLVDSIFEVGLLSHSVSLLQILYFRSSKVSHGGEALCM